ncbi:MAG: Jag N-terminal domain-containing protein [Clostridia bacterium]|nr:Jag N-terminal domain-containing protein [Clostridia bacterium]
MKFDYNVTGKTVQEAYNRAVTLYSSYGEIVNYEIISQGKKGFLGIFGAQPAEIKVTVDDGKGEVTPSAPTTAPKNTPKKKKNNNSNNNRNNNNNNNTNNSTPATPAPESAPEATSAPVESTAPTTEGKGKKKKRSKRGGNSAPRQTVAKEPLRDEDIKVTVEEKTLAMDFIKSFIKSIGFNCEVIGDLTPNEEGFVPRVVTIEGENASALIGHHGETLDAIQYLANLCLARKSDSDHKEYVKVIVDIEGYRAKREETLRALARKMAEKALRLGRNIHLDPMNPYERRIIHSEVQKIEGVSTHSVGYDETRKIIITVDRK